MVGPAAQAKYILGMQAKVQKRIAAAKVIELNPPRSGKKCVVLDIDYTIFDLNSAAERPEELVSQGFRHTPNLPLRSCCWAFRQGDVPTGNPLHIYSRLPT